jgi:hypothetical protein
VNEEKNMSTETIRTKPGTTAETFEEKIAAQLQEAEARLEQFEAKGKAKRVQAEIAAVEALKTARQNIERKLRDLKTINDAEIVRAKADIDTAAAALKTSLDELGRRFPVPPAPPAK